MRRHDCGDFRAESLERRALLSTYFVSPAGNDAGSGGACAPWQTLQRAANAAVAGDTVHVAPGTYATGMNFFGKDGGTAAAPIKFLADPGAVITHRADGGMPNDRLAAINVENTGGYYVIQGFTIHGDGSMERAGIRVAGNSNVQILDNTIDQAYIGIFTSNADDLLIQGNTCTRSTDQHGIYVGANSRRTVVRGNTLWGNTWDGLHLNASYAVGPNDGALVEDNVIYGNDLSGMDVEGATHATFRNNLVHDNLKHGITFHSQDQTAAGDPTPPCLGSTLVNNTITGNHMFAVAFRPEDMADTVVFNNVRFSGSNNASYGSIGVSGSAAGITSDYNVVTDNFSTTLGESTMSFAQWRDATGQEGHSLVAAPDRVFVNPAAYDYRPGPDSPSIDAGSPALAGRHAPYYDTTAKLRPRGSGWDAGAYEDDSVPDTTPPTISGVKLSSLLPKRVTISWITDELSDSQIEYGRDDAYDDFSPLDAGVRDTHAVTLVGLAPDTTYHLRVRSRDSFGNLALSGDVVFGTPPAPTQPPRIAALATDPWVAGASIAWNTDLSSDSLLEYGPTTEYGESIADATLRTAHVLSMDDLAPNTTYHFRLRNRDEYGNTTFSDDQTFTTLAPGQLPPGAVGFWTFDDPDGPTTADVSGNANHGARSGGTHLVSPRDPARNQALSFDGVNGRVRIPRAPSLESDAVTLSAWVKLVLGADQATWVSIIKKDYADDTPPIFGSYSLSISPPGKPNVLSFFTGHANGNDDQLDAPAALPTGQWVHVAATYDPATGQKRLYIDGVLVASRALTRPIAYDPTPAGDLYLGQDPGPGEAFEGAMDDVGVWPRALTANELRTLAYGRLAPLVAPSDLAATVLSYTRVHLAWADHAGGAAHTLLQRRSDGGTWYRVASLDPGVTTFDDTVPPGHLHEYRVFAYDPLTASEPSATVAANTKAGGGGLVAAYFDAIDLSGPAVARTDAQVQFDWGGGSPATGIAADTFSARWSGQVFAYETGNYSFFTTADDGVRLWVNGQLVIDRWADRPALVGDANDDGVVDFTDYQIFQRQDRTTNPQSDFNHDGIVNVADFQLLFANLNKTLHDTTPTDYASVTLQAGRKYDIRLEYFQDARLGSVKLGWVTPSFVSQVIPTDALFPMLTVPPPTPLPNIPTPKPTRTPTNAPSTAPSKPSPKPVPKPAPKLATKIPPPPPPPRPVFCIKPVEKPKAVPKKAAVIPPLPAPKKPAPIAKSRH
jgi:parallel beta-helix repeat protein